MNETPRPDEATPLINDVDHLDDQTWPLRRALRNGSIAVGLILVLSLALWGAIADVPGLWGALIGGVLGGGFMLLTIIVVLLTAKSSPTTTMAVVLGSWLLKAALVLVVMLIIQDLTFYHRPALALTVVLAMVAALATETYAVTKAQRLYVS